jgi:excisionase family DNA binding protein
MSENEIVSPKKVKNRQTLAFSKQAVPLWTVKDVARYLSFRPETIREMARRGELPAVKLNRVWRFSKEKLDVWLEDRYNK